MLACMNDQQLPGMPDPWPLRVTRTGDGRVVAVHAGPLLLSAFGAGDLEMRDLVICSLTEGSRFQVHIALGESRCSALSEPVCRWWVSRSSAAG